MELSTEERTLKEATDSAETKKKAAELGYQKSVEKLREAIREYGRVK